MSVSATIQQQCTVTEVLEGNPDSASAANRTIVHSLFNVAKTLDGASTPAASKTANFVATLVAGALDIDLTALAAANGITLDGTGLKPRYIRVNNLGANPLTITPGAANGHDAFGAASSVTVPAGGSLALYLPDSIAVDATHKVWTLAGTLVETSQWTIVLG